MAVLLAGLDAQAVVFDFNGTITDDERLQADIYREIARELGTELTEERELAELAGVGGRGGGGGGRWGGGEATGRLSTGGRVNTAGPTWFRCPGASVARTSADGRGVG